jgi:hypothetical protein
LVVLAQAHTGGDSIRGMKQPDRDFISGPRPAPPEEVLEIISQQEVLRAAATRGLSSHVRKLSKRNRGLSHWLALAVLVGSAVALAMVQFAIH